MPVIFVGHDSPINSNDMSETLKAYISSSYGWGLTKMHIFLFSIFFLITCTSYAETVHTQATSKGDMVKSANPIKPCPSSPNCVSSVDPDSKRFYPPYEVGSDPQRAWKELKAILSSLPRTKIVNETDNYINAEFKSRIFGFVDDVEFWLDSEAGEIHCRSAARTGSYDFGVNRRRLFDIEQRLRAAMNMESTPGTDALEVVPHVDLNRYKGTWYEIARYPNKFQEGCFESRATYALSEDGKISVLNECYKGSAQGELKSASGKAWIVDPQTNAKLKVSFFWPFSGDYWIIELDDNYQYAVIGHPERKYLWILSRQKTMDGALYNDILRRLEAAHKYDISKVIRTSEQ